MAWAVWLAVPIGATLLVSAWAWWRGRPARVPATHHAMQQHRDYLDALTIPVRGTARAQPTAPDSSG
ncbi:MAG: hypothetical protein ABI232_12195 [Jatrophihabitantaceae bacterium]